MSKAVLISIRPEWVRKILNGSKTVESELDSLQDKRAVRMRREIHGACVFGRPRAFLV